MHKLTIVFGPTGTVWPLMYRTEEAALKAWQLAMANDPTRTLYVEDDFSQKISLPYKSIWGVMLENLEVSKLAHVAHQMHVWHVGAMAQQTATTDPVLRNATRQAGPAVITPQGAVNGFGPRF